MKATHTLPSIPALSHRSDRSCMNAKVFRLKKKKCFQLPLCYLQLFAFLEGMGLLEATFKAYKGIQTGWKMMINHIFAPTLPHSNLLLWVPLVPSVPWGLSWWRVGGGRQHWAALCFVPWSHAPPEVCWAVWSCCAHFPFQHHIFPINDEWERSGRVSLMACSRASNSLAKWVPGSLISWDF